MFGSSVMQNTHRHYESPLRNVATLHTIAPTTRPRRKRRVAPIKLSTGPGSAPPPSRPPTPQERKPRGRSQGGSDWRVRGASVARPWRVRFPCRRCW
eukprot:gene12375-biopygen7886